MNWTCTILGPGRKRYVSDCGKYKIVYYRILSSRASYTIYLNDAVGTYLAWSRSLKDAKANAEHHAKTGSLIGGHTTQTIAAETTNA